MYIPPVRPGHRRRWSREEKLILLQEAEETSVSDVARKYQVSVSLVFRWRRQLGGGIHVTR